MHRDYSYHLYLLLEIIYFLVKNEQKQLLCKHIRRQRSKLSPIAYFNSVMIYNLMCLISVYGKLTSFASFTSFIFV